MIAYRCMAGTQHRRSPLFQKLKLAEHRFLTPVPAVDPTVGVACRAYSLWNFGLRPRWKRGSRIGFRTLGGTVSLNQMPSAALKALARWWLTRKLPSDLRDGDICSVGSGEGGYKIAKVLKIEKSIVHIALYKNRYAQRPTQVDPTILTFGKMDDSDGFGIGHLPLSRGSFATWLPVRIQHSPVTDEELEGYHIWNESKGGVFD